MEDCGLTRRPGMSENTSTPDDSTPHDKESMVTEPSTNPVQQSEMSRMRKLAVFSLTAFVYFLTWSCVNMWSPFFPGEAAKRGLSSTEVGFIFGTYSLVAFLASLIYGPVLIPQIGPYSVLFAGLFVNGGANVISGFMNLITERKLFTIYCFIVRAVGALGGAACETAIIVILTEEFKKNIATVIDS
ncbi:hypothetical protein QZH41_019327 [Actinostola sp. cb2023]|nr:hypothetical protein QZH41_019327 [Actinostola sp. cb2023]